VPGITKLPCLAALLDDAVACASSAMLLRDPPPAFQSRLLGTGVLDLVARSVESVLTVNDRCHLARVVLGHIGIDVTCNDQDPRNRVSVVSDLVPTLRPAWKRQHLALRKDAITVMHQDGRRPSQDDQQLLASVVEVIDELRRSRLKLPNRCAEGIRRRPNKLPCSESTPIRNLVPNVRGVLAHAMTIPRRARLSRQRGFPADANRFAGRASSSA